MVPAQRIFLTATALILVGGLSACGLFGENNSCQNLQVGVDQNAELTVFYSLTVSGKASASRVTYQSDQGTQRVSDPTQVASPDTSWSTSVTIGPDTRAFASAEAQAQNGTVTLRLEAVSGDGTTVKKAECGTQRK